MGPVGVVVAIAELAAELDAGGEDDAAAAELEAAWAGGWWRSATRRDAHPGRIGGRCRPTWAVVHTTDMHPGTWGGLQTRLQREAGRGAGAHFWVGRTPEQGLVQSVSVDRNANHAGGATHGWFVTPGGAKLHPNSYAVGIEVHCAGAVIVHQGHWYAIDRSRDVDGDGRRDVMPTGAALPDAEIEADPRRPGRGWHRPSAWQLEQLAALLAALAGCPLRAPAPAGWSVRPNGSPQGWAPAVVIGGLPVVGHVTLDPADKLDPWPPLSRWLQQLAVSRAG